MKAVRIASPSIKKKKTNSVGPDSARVKEILKRLKKAYSDAKCALKHSNPFELLVATILSAQCTDERVNQVTPGLFKNHPTPQDFAALRPEVLEQEIRSTGFYKNKAKSILGTSKKIAQEFGGKVPETMDELLTLPGVARKTANVVLGTAFRKTNGVVVDTHVHRLSNRLDLSYEKTPGKIEQDLMRIIPQSGWIDFSHQMIFHGRRYCQARKPKCFPCPVEDLCHSPDKIF